MWHTVVPYSKTFCYDMPLVGGNGGAAQSAFASMAYDRIGAYLRTTTVPTMLNGKGKSWNLL